MRRHGSIHYNAGMTSVTAGLAHDIAIIGGGASGVLTAIHLLHAATTPVRIALYEPQPTLAQGVAYATPYPEHLLNVPAQRMSAFNDQPDDFLDFLSPDPQERAALAPAFVERHRYGEYLRDRLARARDAGIATLEHVTQPVTAMNRCAGGWRLQLADGAEAGCAAVVLAVGNRPRPLPARGTSGLSADASLSAWDFDAVRAVPPDARLCIVGSGLSMVDAVLSFVATGHRGAIHVLSRHGWLPQPHAAHAVADFDPAQLLPLDLRARLRFVRQRAREAASAGVPWQAVMERLRPHGQALWRSLSGADQRRFLRHVVRLWDVHRHRVAGSVHAQMQALIDRGQLRLHRGRLDTVMQVGRCVQVGARVRGQPGLELEVDRVVNATGVEMRVQTMRNPLLTGLLGEGHAQAGPHGIGIAADDAGRVLDAEGRAQPDLWVLGSLRIGSLWETTAIPELRGQAEAVARQALAR